MMQQEFNRENNSLPIIYDPNTFEQIRRYRLTRNQIEFLIKIEKTITGMNYTSAPDVVWEDSAFIKQILPRSWYQHSEIERLMSIREKYKYLYHSKSSWSEIHMI